MNTVIIEKINQLINEEKWTRTTIDNYSMGHFEELDNLIKEINDDETKEEVIRITEEHLDRSKNSIGALYISGNLILSKRLLDDSNMLQLISMFGENGKWNIVEILCNKMLSYGENKYALKALADCYKNEANAEKKHEVWERLIKIDFEEADIVKALAEEYEKEGNGEKSLDYYKKAIHRYANKKLFANVKEIWDKLIGNASDDPDFFYHFLKKVSKTMPEDKMIELLDSLYQFYKNEKNWDSAIDILKKIIAIDSKDNEIRKEILFCFKEKYGNHNQFDEFVRLSSLSQNWRNINDAISDFEKHIAFDAGNFVYHKTWGIGRIKGLQGENIIIDFLSKKNHSMSVKMAVNSLTILSREHIWVIKCTTRKEALREKIKKNVAWTLRTIIKSFNNEADLKRIKLELTPGILTQNEWVTWRAAAKEELETNPQFGSIAEKEGFYEVRIKPISAGEKAYNSFKSENEFFKKLHILQKYIARPDADSEFLPEMLAFFRNHIKTISTVDEKVTASYLFISGLANTYADCKVNITFQDLYSRIKDKDVEGIFIKLSDNDLKKSFLENVRINVPDWHEIYCRLFHHFLYSYIPEVLIRAGYTDRVKGLFRTYLEDYKNYREGFVWVCQNGAGYDFFNELKPAENKIITEMIHLLDITFRESSSKKNVIANKKINNKISIYLFKDKNLDSFLNSANMDTASRIYDLLVGIELLDLKIKLAYRELIKKRFPKIEFSGEKPVEAVSRGGIIVTEAGMEKRQQKLKYILEVEIPKNSKEIGDAIALGDLSENAEYKFGKEKQNMLNHEVSVLKEEIEKAQVFDARNVNTSRISFGTKATLLNLDTNENCTYTILGPWESLPEENIISYMAPLGAELLNAEKDNELHFEINGREYNFKVLSIEKSDLI